MEIDIKDGTAETQSHWCQDSKPIVLIDFDHTITKKCLACEDGLEGDAIQRGAADAIRELSKKFRIWIFTGNQDHAAFAKGLQRSKQQIEEILQKNKIPFEKVLQIKPPAIFIIDDRAIHHRAWDQTFFEIWRRMRMKDGYHG